MNNEKLIIKEIHDDWKKEHSKPIDPGTLKSVFSDAKVKFFSHLFKTKRWQKLSLKDVDDLTNKMDSILMNAAHNKFGDWINE